MTRQPIRADLDAPGPWMLHRIDGRSVYMRASTTASRVTIRSHQAGVLCDLGVACDLDQADSSRLVVNPHQEDWVKAEAVRKALLQCAAALWRRRGLTQPAKTVTRQFGSHVYEFWPDPDPDAARVEITRRQLRTESVAIDEHLGHVGDLDIGSAEVRLRERDTLPSTLLTQLRALAGEAWQARTGASPRVEGARR